MIIRHAVHQRDGQRLARVVADDRDHIHVQFADAVAIEQIAEAMVELAHHQHDLAPRGLAPQRPMHRIAHRKRLKIGPDLVEPGPARVKFHAHEERTLDLVVELLGLDDVGAGLREAAGDRGGNTGGVAARQRQDQVVGGRNQAHRGQLSGWLAGRLARALFICKAHVS
jgi:hypothetical protein